MSENTTNGAQPESMPAVREARRDPRPAAPSNVVDLFVAATAYHVDRSQAEALHRQRERYVGGYSERDLVGRLLTAAARAMRRSVDQASPAPIASGTEAFAELQAVRGAGRSRPAPRRSGLRGLRLARARERGQLELVEALELASDRLGPLPAGGPGQVKAPDAAPRLVEGVDPAPDELAGMAAHAGAALGHFATARSDVDPVGELREALEGP